MPDPEAGLPAELRAAIATLRRRDFAVFPAEGDRWHVGQMILGPDEMIAKAQRWQQRAIAA
ncbi:MAG: hypothetical protein U1E45_14895 [Geminicoccaceae bacterium]